MSYLLDALKQSQPSDMSPEHYDLQAQQAKHQAALARYRFLAYVFGGGLVIFLTVGSGFLAGKWLQTFPLNRAEEHVNVQTPAIETAQQQAAVNNGASDSLASKQSTVINPPLPTPQQPPAQVVNNAATLKGQVVYVQTSSGIQQMLLTPQGQYIPLLTHQVSNNQGVSAVTSGIQQPVTQLHNGQLDHQVNVAQITNNEANRTQSSAANAVAKQPQAGETSAATLDLSKYKVLGKPLAEPQQTPAEKQRTLRTSEPTPVEAAFEHAVQETEKNPDYQVTQATRNSSRVEPVELLPDGLQALLPALKYQAHIYSSSVDKRWIKLNGRELYEGDSIGALTVREIAPEQSVLDFDGYQFSLKALQDWPQ
jgi:general secretion pathway protein B